MHSSFSVEVADKLRSGVPITTALLEVLGGIRDGSAPRTSDVLADLIELKAWTPRLNCFIR